MYFTVKATDILQCDEQKLLTSMTLQSYKIQPCSYLHTIQPENFPLGFIVVSKNSKR